MKKFLASLSTVLVLSFYVFPTGFTFLPAAINSKMLVAGLGVAAFIYRSIRGHMVEISRIVLISGLIASVFSLWCYVAVILAGTHEMVYVHYMKSFFTWVLGAYGALVSMKFFTGKDDLPTLSKYLAVLCVGQCVLALLIDNVGFVSSLVDSIFSFSQIFFRDGGRLYGVGCALDVAGVRFAAMLLLFAHQISTNREVGENSLSITTYLLAFFVTTLIGCAISRTTMVGAGLGLAYMALANMGIQRGGFVSNRQVRLFIVGFVVIAFAIVLSVYLYQSSTVFHDNMRFGFEGFFNWAETGEFRTGSTDHLQTMYVWPDNPRTWLIGEGIIGVFATASDVGYVNFIFYCGLVGMVLFSLFFIYNHLCLNEKYDNFAILSLMLVAMTFIIWSKVMTDIFFIDALLFCAAGDVKFYRR